MKWRSLSCVWLCDPMSDKVHGILQARILEWVDFPFSRGSFQPRDQTQVFCITGRFFYQLSYQGSPRILEWVAYPISSGSSWPRNQTGVSCIAGRLLGFRTGVYRQRSTNINKRSVLTKWFFFFLQLQYNTSAIIHQISPKKSYWRNVSLMLTNHLFWVVKNSLVHQFLLCLGEPCMVQ